MTRHPGTAVVPSPGSSSYRWWVLLVTSVGALLASLTAGTLVIALPDILRDLHTDLFTLLWIVVGYTLVATVLVLNAGRLADILGRGRMYTAGFVVFTLASIFCALAPSSLPLVGGRLLQGIGGAALMATSAALVTDAFPRRELGRALGINAMVVGAGLILGPILGGFLTALGWRTVFWFNVPIGIVGTVAAFAILHDDRPATRRIEVDWAGSALYFVGLMGLMSALAFGGIYGWTTPWVLAGFGGFLLATPVFLWVERRSAAPLLDLDLFRDRMFTMGNLTGLLNGIARNGVLFLLVFYLQGVKGDDPVLAGILLAPLAVGLLVISPISGALADRYGSRELATLGMLVTAAGLAGLMTLAVDTPYWQLALWQLVIGAGSGLFNSPNTSAVMGAVPAAKRGVGAGTRMMLTQSGFVISIALAIGLVTSAMDPQVMLAIFAGTQTGSSGVDLDPFIQALHLAFGVGVLASLVGAAISWMRGPANPEAEAAEAQIEAGAGGRPATRTAVRVEAGLPREGDARTAGRGD
jgi:EmrB/QacA subfamily drug resistance transporter